MKLNEITRDHLAHIPAIGHQTQYDGAELGVYAHFYAGPNHWYIVEYDGDDTFIGHECFYNKGIVYSNIGKISLKNLNKNRVSISGKVRKFRNKTIQFDENWVPTLDHEIEIVRWHNKLIVTMVRQYRKIEKERNLQINQIPTETLNMLPQINDIKDTCCRDLTIFLHIHNGCQQWYIAGYDRNGTLLGFSFDIYKGVVTAQFGLFSLFEFKIRLFCLSVLKRLKIDIYRPHINTLWEPKPATEIESITAYVSLLEAIHERNIEDIVIDYPDWPIWSQTSEILSNQLFDES